LRTVWARPNSNASAINAWPMETSRTLGTRHLKFNPFASHLKFYLVRATLSFTVTLSFTASP
jgi:hypothetical protein